MPNSLIVKGPHTIEHVSNSRKKKKKTIHYYIQQSHATVNVTKSYSSNFIN